MKDVAHTVYTRKCVYTSANFICIRCVACLSFSKAALFCVELYLMRLAVTMFILGVGTSPGGRAWAGKSNTMNAGVGGGRPLTSPAPGSVGRRSTISYDQAKTSSSSTERTNDAPRYSDIQLFIRYCIIKQISFSFFSCDELKDEGTHSAASTESGRWIRTIIV